MLTITRDAEQALDAIVAAQDVPEGAGVRISQGVGADGQPGIGLTLTTEPAVDDAVVEEGTVPVFLAAEVVELLEDKVLDAQIEGDSITFEIGQQPDSD